MATRFQHVFLKLAFPLLIASGLASTAHAQQVDKPISGSADSIDNEYFEVGLYSGVLNIQDFPSAIALGVNVSFKATEDFFLQFNYMRADDVDLSSNEQRGGVNRYFSGSNRSYTHRGLLIGYNLYQAEFFFREGKANLATLYIVGGVGDTKFGGEASFTYTTGIGYEVAFARRFVARIDYRDFSYTSALINDRETDVRNGMTSFGFGFLF